eukprot:Gb_05398 [translate_table: standard]
MDDGYNALVTIHNYQQYRHIDNPGWSIDWSWAGREIIWEMVRAEAKEQGDSGFKFDDVVKFEPCKYYALGVPQQGILINGQFLGPQIDSVTNDNLVINVFNSLDQPFLLSWNGVQQRRNSWQDGTQGTNCAIPPSRNYTYQFQVKDQIGSYFYFPSMYFHKEGRGFRGLRIVSRPRIPVPFLDPAGDYIVLIGDWYKTNHSILWRTLDMGSVLGMLDDVLINGRRPNGASFTVDQGKTYRFYISNVGLASSLNFRIQGHKMKLVEVEGSNIFCPSLSNWPLRLICLLSILGANCNLNLIYMGDKFAVN